MALKSQTIFWGETFGVGTTCANNQGTLANGFNSTNGIWSINTSLGTNDAFANVWYVSQTEAGRLPGVCGASCIDSAQLTDRTLHIGAAQNSPTYGVICPTGDCGAIYDPGLHTGVHPNLVRTNVRAESPIISTIGKTGISLQFNYIFLGNKRDSFNVWAFDGAVWVNLGAPAPTLTCSVAGVPPPANVEGTWAVAGPYNLSANFNNNGAVKIGFQWINNDDSLGGKPSVAIDDIILKANSTGGGPSTLTTVAVFSPDTANHNYIYCTNTPYHFTGFANPGPILAYQWYVRPSANVVFNPAHPGLGQNGVDVTFPTIGTYTLTVVASSQYNGIDSNAHVPSTPSFTPFVINVNQTPTVTVLPLSPVFVCQGGTGANLYATATSPCTYTWTQAASVVPPTYLDANGDSVNVNPPGVPSPVVTYSVVGTTTTGCASPKVVVTVSVAPRPTPVYSPTDTICAGAPATLFVTNMPVNTTYHWGAAFGAGLGSSTGSTVQETPIYHNLNNSSADTTIQDTIIVHVPGCPNYAFHLMYVIVKPTPKAHVLADTVDNCNKTGAVLSAVGTPTAGISYNWSPSTALSSVTGATVTAKPLVPMTYYMTPVRDGCSGLRDSVKVLIGDTVSAGISSEFDIICNAQSNQFIATPQNTPPNNIYHYVWKPNNPTVYPSVTGDTLVVRPTTNTVYTLTVYGTCVKHNIATYGITVNNCIPPIAGFTQSDDTICRQQCITFKDTTQLHSTKPLYYTWVFVGADHNNGSNNGIIHNPPGSIVHGDTLYYNMTNNKPLPAFKVCYNVNSALNNSGFYPITETVKNGLNQTSTYIDSVKVYPGPTATVIPNQQTIEQGTSTNLNASQSGGGGATTDPIVSYDWTQTESGPMSCTSGISCNNPIVTPSVTTQYVVTVTDKYGCFDSAVVTINVDVICKEVYIATAFSPNGDGMNDVLHVKSNCEITQFSFKIFDRWGEKVFESVDQTFGWDGTFRNKLMDSGVFMYTLDGFLSNGIEVKKKGNVTLIR
ncbi:MAG TPA: gliding motility-associated C-terminal domain-containing protein [Bacteroidia bacterium]|nr:gliding motility-associated C-terminal domain-containing protein [Bacteroidia bacterium]